MKRWIVFSCIFALLIVASFSSYVYVYRAEFLSTALSRALDTTVLVKKIEFSKNGVLVDGLSIENPAGPSFPNLFSVNTINVKIDFKELLKDISGIGSDRITIDEIRIDNPKMVVELYSLGLQDNNWKRLIQKSTQTSAKAKQEKPSAKPSRRFFIKKFLITNIQLEVNYANIAIPALTPPPIDKIELKNLGKDEPLSTQEVLKSVLEELVGQVLDRVQSGKFIK